MRRLVVLLGAFLPLVCGCGLSGKKSVFVDVDAIVKQESTSTQPQFKLPTPPAPMPGMAFSLPAKTEKIVRDSGGQINTSIAEIEKAQADAIRALNRRLRALYASEVARFTRDQLAAFDIYRSKAYDDANTAIRSRFVDYGNQRGQLLASLAVIVGWPDTNPTSKGDTKFMRVVQKILFEKSKKLREDIAKLDSDFSAHVDTLLSGAQGVSGQKLANVQLAIEKFRDEMNKKADAEAAKQVRATPKELDIRLAGARTTILPAIPAQTIQIPASAPMPPAPQVTFSGIGNGTEDRRRMVEQELQIWLGLNRLTLAKRGNGTPDVTDEFRAWRKTLQSDGR